MRQKYDWRENFMSDDWNFFAVCFWYDNLADHGYGDHVSILYAAYSMLHTVNQILKNIRWAIRQFQIASLEKTE